MSLTSLLDGLHQLGEGTVLLDSIISPPDDDAFYISDSSPLSTPPTSADSLMEQFNLMTHSSGSLPHNTDCQDWLQ